MKQRPSDAAIEGVVTIARNGIDRIRDLERDKKRLEQLTDDLFSTLLAALSVAEHGSTAYRMLDKAVAEFRPRWIRKEIP